jgi:uracil-DNA glycosylase family 4
MRSGGQTMTGLTQHQIIDLLRQHLDAGCTDVLAQTPVHYYQQGSVASPEIAPAAIRETPAHTPSTSAPGLAEMQDARQASLAPASLVKPAMPIAKPATPNAGGNEIKDAIAMAKKAAAGADTLEQLHQAIQSFELCGLKSTAKNCVFQDGSLGSKVMLIGEAPGKEEDLEGRPFVGPAGQMLDKMLASIGLSRDENVYLTNIVPWRPPGNRSPSVDEIAMCQPFVERHIELAQPEILLLAGNISSKTLLGTQVGITKLRGQWQTYQPETLKLKALPMLHPAYLVRRPETKADVWADLCALKAKLVNA